MPYPQLNQTVELGGSPAQRAKGGSPIPHTHFFFKNLINQLNQTHQTGLGCLTVSCNSLPPVELGFGGLVSVVSTACPPPKKST